MRCQLPIGVEQRFLQKLLTQSGFGLMLSFHAYSCDNSNTTQTQIAWCDQDIQEVIDILQAWILLQQEEAVSLTDKHKVLYFLKVVSELVSRLYLYFDVTTIKQLWKALFSAYPYVQCRRKNLRVALA